MVFTIEFCDKIREILELVKSFENNEKRNYDIYLISTPMDYDIKKLIHNFQEELIESSIISVKDYRIIMKIRNVFLNIEYGVNNDNNYIRYDYYLTLSN